MLKISLWADPAEKKAEKQRKNQVEVLSWIHIPLVRLMM